jgi:hypothetical protein
MLKPDEKPERKRERWRWPVLLLLPPLFVLGWVLFGIDVKFGAWRLGTAWEDSAAPRGFFTCKETFAVRRSAPNLRLIARGPEATPIRGGFIVAICGPRAFVLYRGRQIAER